MIRYGTRTFAIEAVKNGTDRAVIELRSGLREALKRLEDLVTARGGSVSRTGWSGTYTETDGERVSVKVRRATSREVEEPR